MRKQDLKQSPSSPAASPVSPSPPPESGGVHGLGVKASAGIRDKEKALAMVKAGADRLGTSSGVAIVS